MLNDGNELVTIETKLLQLRLRDVPPAGLLCASSGLQGRHDRDVQPVIRIRRACCAIPTAWTQRIPHDSEPRSCPFSMQGSVP
jgi:hypothetical protein